MGRAFQVQTTFKEGSFKEQECLQDPGLDYSFPGSLETVGQERGRGRSRGCS